ncbi:MAG: redox-regulated ATPase YchF [Thermodesulfovibrionales bacterium]|nr:redox-regulated ATPase YchF [Thermodesulfovibrionales bacterium]
MKVAIIGLSNTGKTTVFNALTGQHIETTIYQATSGEPHVGIVKVPDSRLDSISALFKPKKTTHATIEYIDFIGLTKGDVKQNRQVFDLIKDADAIMHVVRLFSDDSVIHPLGSINAPRDIETIELELIFGDLEFVEKRLERMGDGLKRGKKPDESEKRLLLKCRDMLMKEIPLRNVEFTEEDLHAMRPLQFLSIIPEIVVLNFGEKDFGSEKEINLLEELSNRYRSLSFLPLCGKIEMEIAQLSPADKKMFLDDMGLNEPAAHKLIHSCYELLGLISFFTYAGDEVRAWTVKKGTPAQKAASKVHSDIERGFIRAEVISFEDFVSAGDIHTARGKGILRLEGKTYEVKDGDIINFRFNV